MNIVDQVNPIIRQKSHVRFTVLFKLLVLLSFPILFQLCDVFPDSYAHAADEKTISHEKKFPSSPGIHKTGTIRDELERISGYAEDIFELAKADRWKRASKKLIALEKVEQSLTDNTNNLGADNLSALSKSTSDLEKAVSIKNRQDAMTSANKITAIAALIAKPFSQRVPTNILLLDYYGRELEIWSEMKNSNKLAIIVSKMHLTWQNLMPLVIAEGASKNVKKFGEIMKHLEAAKTPEEYGRLATSALDEIDNLEKVFTQRSSKTE
jgi:hypothetical protein